MRAHRAGPGALIALLLAGCGGSGPDAPAGTDVVRAWTDAVREQRYDRAAALFALPSTITNGVTVRATRRAEVDIFNRSLSCGAVLKSTTRTDDGRLVATFRLVNGASGTRCSGAAHVSFRIEKGHITEWIREDNGPPPGAQET